MRTVITLAMILFAAAAAAVEWELVGVLPDDYNSVRCLEADPDHERLLMGMLRGYRLYLIPHDAWLIREDPQVEFPVYCFASDPSDSTTLFTGRSTSYWDGQIMDNSGLVILGNTVWFGGPVEGLARDPSQYDRLFACSAPWYSGPGEIVRSEDGGSNWTTVHSFSMSIGGTAVAVAANGDVYVGYGVPGYPYDDHGILRSTDHGESWDAVSGDMPLAAHIGDIEIDPADSQHMYVRQGGWWEPADPALGIYETTDGGQHWSQILSGNSMDLSMHPEDASILVTSGMMLTRNGGNSWEDISGNLPLNGGIYCTISSSDDRIYVACCDSVFATYLDLTAADSEVVPSPVNLSIHPNPFNPLLTILFSLSYRDHARVSVYDVSGREIICLADGMFGPGFSYLTWSGVDCRGRPLASGVYLVILTANNQISTQRAVLLK